MGPFLCWVNRGERATLILAAPLLGLCPWGLGIPGCVFGVLGFLAVSLGMACVLGVWRFPGLCPWGLGIPWLVSLGSGDSMALSLGSGDSLACVLGAWGFHGLCPWGLDIERGEHVGDSSVHLCPECKVTNCGGHKL